MENRYKLKAILMIAFMSLAPIACQKSYVLAPVSPQSPITPVLTSTNTPISVSGTATPSIPTSTPTGGGPSPTATYSPTKTITPVPATQTFTPTPVGTFVVPSGLWVVGIFLDDVTAISGYNLTTTTCSVYISTNSSPETTDAVTLITPSGSIPVIYSTTTTYQGTAVAEYLTGANTFTYTFNAPYSLHAVTSLGTADATVSAPGNITIAADGSTASASYPGNYDSAVVEEISPAAVTTYQSTTGVSVGSPFTYPLSAYPAPAGTGTYGVAYNAAVTDINVAGPNVAVGSAWVGDEVALTEIIR